MATSRIADSVGRVLGDRYRLTRPLGTGASAHVYVAEDVSLRRRVAIKVLHPALAGDAAFLRRFRAEAQAVASLRHPNILTVFDWGDDDGAPFLVMELLEGGSLRSMLDRGALLSTGQAAAVGGDAARALDYAHRRGLVHRDIKPANLIFDDDGRVRVADFGLARALAEATWTEPTGAVVGTARYAAPEQVRGERLDSRADVYSLAVMLVEATTGKVPFAADTTLGTLMARIERPLEVPDTIGPLKEVLEKAGTVDPADRMDAAALAHALDRIAAKVPPPAPLPLMSPLLNGMVENDDLSPTEYPGKPRLFDLDAIEGDAPVAADIRTRSVDSVPLVRRGSGVVPPPESPDPVRRPPSGDDGVEDLRALDAPRSRRRRWAWLAVVVVVLAIAGGGVFALASSRGWLLASHPVPALVGDTPEQAQAVLAPLHLKLAVTGAAYSSARPMGQIVSQIPTGGTLKEKSLVRAVLSKGPAPVAVPGVVGEAQAQATAKLRALRLGVTLAKQEASMTVPSGDVISQSPSGGELIPGQSVALTISTGKPMVAVPSLDQSQSASFSAAQSALAGSGLVPSETLQYSNSVPEGQVIATSPGSGTQVVVGSTVSVVVSKGPQLFPVPGVAGDSVSQATLALQAAGFVVGGVNGTPTAAVTGTSPGPGTELRADSVVWINT